MALLVEVDPNQAKSVEERSGTKNGRDWSMRSQRCWVFPPESKFPIETQLVLPEKVQNYPAGEYQLDLDQAFTTGSFKSPMLVGREMVLKPRSK